MHVLLIENQELDKNLSLLPNLEAQGHFVNLAHTPENAAQQTSGGWPNLIVFNQVQTKLNITSFQEALDQTGLNVPYLVINDENNRQPQLSHSIEAAMGNQKDRFLRVPGLVIDLQQEGGLDAARW